MPSILEPINLKWESSLELLSTAGKLYAGEVPEVDEDGNLTEFPYTYYRVDSTSFDYLFGPRYFEHNHVTFDVFCSGMAAAEAAVNKIQTTYAWTTDLNFEADTTSSVFSIRPLSPSIRSVNFRDKNGLPVYRGTLSMMFTINRVQA